MSHPPRQVTLVLCLPDGVVLGSLPPFEVEFPWWQEAWPVVEGAQAAHGVDVTVLRLLDATPTASGTAGGHVTYLAEVSRAPRMAPTPWSGDPTDDEPLRMTWARPGGPAADLAWADAALEGRGTPRIAEARQIRTWNLSSLWRLPVDGGAAWLKVVPPFFAHEGGVLERLAPGIGPPVIARDGPRVLLAEVAGEDRYDATGAVLLRMVSILVSLQADWSSRTDELLALGAPDWRLSPLEALAEDVVARTAHELDPSDVRVLEALVRNLPERLDEVAACGIPDTLVHGDFHPGNVRGTDDRLVLLDWGDCSVGHPLLDQAAFVAATAEDEGGTVRAEWARLWHAAVPGSDPERAASLLEPIAAVRQAVVYRSFLDRIEPSERVYHASDPARWLRRAAGLTASS